MEKIAHVAQSERLRWFNEARFGMFIHWGLYAIPGRGEWAMYKEPIPREEYNRLADRFVPEHFDADAWAALAKRAGARYMVLTTRHHDGFCLYDSQVSDFTSVKSAARRDFVAEYVAACRRAGLRVGLYYSLMDWQFPGYYDWRKYPDSHAAMVDQAHAQVRELMSNYGPIDMLWYDGGCIPGTDPGMIAPLWRSRELNDMARSLQPQLLINNRSGLAEDFDTPEQHVVATRSGRAWEACMTIGATAWGYVAAEREFKPVSELLRCLVLAASGGGNFLLNVGPRADGSIQPEFVTRLEAMGHWLEVNGEAIYGSRRTALSMQEQPLGLVTRVGRKAYWHCFAWPGERAALAGVTPAGKRAQLLGWPQSLPLGEAYAGRLDVTGLPAQPPSPLGGVLALTVGRRAAPIPRLLVEQGADRHDPAPTPLRQGADLFAALRSPVESQAAATLCPGWQGPTVAVAGNGRIELELEVAWAGRYRLRLGLLGLAPGRLTVAAAGLGPLGEMNVGAAGFPDSLVVADRAYPQGRLRLTLRHENGAALGLYGCVLDPIYTALPSTCWGVLGPYPTPWDVQRPLHLVKAGLETPQAPELPGGENLRWRMPRHNRGPYAEAGVNFQYIAGVKSTGVFYALARIVSPTARRAELLIGCDWWLRAWLNGRPIASGRAAQAEDGADFSGWRPLAAAIELAAGENSLLVKCHRGSNACWFTCYLSDPGDLAHGQAPLPRVSCHPAAWLTSVEEAR